MLLTESVYKINCSKENIFAKKVIFCNGRNISDVFKSQINTYYAPMLVYKITKKKFIFEIADNEKKANNCIVKENNFSVVGGASFNNLEEANKELINLDNLFKVKNPDVVKKKDILDVKMSLLHMMQNVTISIIFGKKITKIYGR